jgi:hypothetical protein
LPLGAEVVSVFGANGANRSHYDKVVFYVEATVPGVAGTGTYLATFWVVLNKNPAALLTFATTGRWVEGWITRAEAELRARELQRSAK